MAAALALVAGRASFWAAGVAWLAYLSLASVGDVFLSFQWDALLLESGLVALFAASREPRLGVWLARALLWKLMFLSGAVKLLSGDSTWRDLSALSYHWWTQPLPLPTGRLGRGASGLAAARVDAGDAGDRARRAARAARPAAGPVRRRWRCSSGCSS